MATTFNLLIAVLLLCADTGNTVEADVACSVSAVYDSQIGVRELTGRNDGPEVAAYLKAADMNQPVAWCGAFVKWCFVQCGIETTGNAWAPSWFPKSRLVKEPRQADVFGLYYPKLKRIGHVGFIDKIQGENLITVEGNTNKAGSREGDGVYRKRRLKSQIYKISRWAS